MDYDILSMLLIGWLVFAFYIHYSIDDFKNWREQPPFLKLVMFHVGLGFIVFSFMLFIFLLKWFVLSD